MLTINLQSEPLASNPRLQAAFAGALVSRGKGAGQLKAKCPPMGTDAAIAWQALILVANPYKAGIGHLMLCRDHDFLAECQAFADTLRGVETLDRDRRALTRLGAW